MKELSDFLINMIEANTKPGPHRFGPFTDTMLAMLKSRGNKYESYFKVSNNKLIPLKVIPKNINPVLVMVAPYLADDIGMSSFAKAEAEYVFEKIKNNLNQEQYELGNNMISAYDEFTDQQRKEYQEYKNLFSKLP